MDAAFPNAHALVIAISAYTAAGPLPAAVIHDAEDVAAILRSPERCGYDPSKVHTLLDRQATKSAILDALAHLALVARPDDTVCVYFSGHGWRQGGSDESFLIPVDADTTDLATSALSATDFSDALHAIQVARLIVILDACHAGGAGALKAGSDTAPEESGISAKSMSLLSTGAGRAIFASSTIDETSLIMPGARNSAFTSALIEGLTGAADYHREGVVKLFSLFDYLAERVPVLTSDRQHPLLLTKLERNFAIALNLGLTKDVAANPPTHSPKVETALRNLFPDLYPAGPVDQHVWERAGGDLSRLTLAKPGRAMWHEALRLLERGGGGAVNVRALIAEARADFPQNEQLRALS